MHLLLVSFDSTLVLAAGELAGGSDRAGACSSAGAGAGREGRLTIERERFEVEIGVEVGVVRRGDRSVAECEGRSGVNGRGFRAPGASGCGEEEVEAAEAEEAVEVGEVEAVGRKDGSGLIRFEESCDDISGSCLRL
jgi:hypothetical protein